MIEKYVHSQDSNFKLSSVKSGETSINLSNEILAYIMPELSLGDETSITFRLHKKDFVTGISFISTCLPLYKSTSQTSSKITLDISFFSDMVTEVINFFGADETKEYSVNLKYRDDGRIYLNNLSVDGFNVRHFLVEEKTTIIFDRVDSVCDLRLTYGTDECLVKDKVIKHFCRKVILKLYEIDQLEKFSAYFRTSSANYLQVVYGDKCLYRLLNPNLSDYDGGFRWFNDKISIDGQDYILCAEWTEKENNASVPCFDTLKSLIDILYQGDYELFKRDGCYCFRGTTQGQNNRINRRNQNNDQPLQQIWYGAPGTGKSHEISKETRNEAVVRTTFHPDSDYSTFVGAYKPVMDDVDVLVTPVVTSDGIKFDPVSRHTEKRITYRFVKQAFLKAYLGAWKKYSESPESPAAQYLVIEEINRGNCAQIFGDIFQLLDRGDNGFSEYPIESDEDLRQEILRAFAEEEEYKLAEGMNINNVVENYTSNYGEGRTLTQDLTEGRVMLLPNNLYIWATMNTSDQSLFPIDSAFKRRWEWVYVPIKNCDKGYYIECNGKQYDWYGFVDKMNEKILTATDSADKQMGYFFVKSPDGVITAGRFVNKVLFYLYSDVFRDENVPEDYFEGKGGKTMKFSDFFNKDNGKVDVSSVELLMNNMELKDLASEVTPPEGEADSPESENEEDTE